MKRTQANHLYSSTFFFFLLPLLNILLGSIFAANYQTVQITAFFVLYIFVLINQTLENILLRMTRKNFEISKTTYFLLEFANILTILFFALKYSWLAALTLALYSINIQIQFLFDYYNLRWLAQLITAALKVGLLNMFSFYIHTGFIQFKFVPYYLGLFIPFYIYERIRLESTIKTGYLYILIASGYIFSTLILWPTLGAKILILLATLPAVRIFHKKQNQKNILTFLLIFSITYLILTTLTLFF